MKKTTFQVTGMHCASCASTITRKLSKIEGVESCQVNLATEEARITYDQHKTGVKDFNQQISKFGYSLKDENKIEQNKTSIHQHDHGLLDSDQEKNDIEFTLPIALIVFALMIWDVVASQLPTVPKMPIPMPVFNTISFILATIILFGYGKSFISAMGRFIEYRVANMDTLVGIGTLTAYIYSAILYLFPVTGQILGAPDYLYFDVTIIVIGFIRLGKYLENKSKQKTGEAIEKLLHLGAKTAILLKDNKQIEVSIEEVKLGDILVVKPGEKVPVDGKIIEGRSSIDESMITGESIPVDKNIGDEVIGGTINKQSFFMMEATKIGEDSVLSQIVKMVKEAQGSKAPIERLADTISAVFVPTVLVLATLALIGWSVIGSQYMPVSQSISFGIISFVGILVIACPCALGLATPTAIIVGVGKAAQNGIFIKNAENLENFNKINYIVFDKTGTLTKGQPQLTDAIITAKLSKSDAYSLIGSLEQNSSHPLAKAIMNKVDSQKIVLQKVGDFITTEGKGVEGKIKGKLYYAGNQKFIEEKNISVNSQTVSSLTIQGKTPVILASKKQVLAYFGIADTVKPEAKEVVEKIKKQNIKVAMITGDNRQVARYIGNQVGIDTVIDSVLPGQKADEIKKLQEKGYKVAMVGDGINDAPALVTADVGVAMSTGTDVAIESAGITLLSGNLDKLFKTIVVARKTMNTVKQNLFWAFFYNVIGIPVAAGILYPILGSMLSPAIAGAAMAFSSVSVVGNSLRLKTTKV